MVGIRGDRHGKLRAQTVEMNYECKLGIGTINVTHYQCLPLYSTPLAFSLAFSLYGESVIGTKKNIFLKSIWVIDESIKNIILKIFMCYLSKYYESAMKWDLEWVLGLGMI